MSLANDCDEMAAYILKEDEKYSIVADVLVRAAAALRSARPEAALTTVEFCGKPAAAPCAIAEQCQYGKDSDTIIEACAQVCDTEAALSVGMYREIREALAESIRGLKRSQPQNGEGSK